jgi:hypothetical protein
MARGSRTQVGRNSSGIFRQHVRRANANAFDVAMQREDLADDGVVVELGDVAPDGGALGGSVDTQVVDAGPIADRLEVHPVLFFELGRNDGIDAPFDHQEGALISRALGGPAHCAMVRMRGDALWFEDDERGDVICEPAIDALSELTVGPLVERPIGEVEQRGVRNAENPSGVEELATTDVAKLVGGTQGAGFPVGEAQDAHFTSLTRQMGKQRTEPEGFVVGVRDYRSHGTLGDREPRYHIAHRATTPNRRDRWSRPGAEPSVDDAIASLIGRRRLLQNSFSATVTRTGRERMSVIPRQYR